MSGLGAFMMKILLTEKPHKTCGIFCVFCIKSKENKTMTMNQLSIQLQAPYSEERRRKASESAKQTGLKRRTE